MAIRGPNAPRSLPPEVIAQQPGARTRDLASPIQRLIDFGMARTPQEAKKLMAELLASLRAAGFPVSAAGSAEGQLGSALTLFQESRGLPTTGQLDQATRDALADAGHLPRSDAGVSAQPRAGDAASDMRPRADAKLGVGELSLRAPSGTEGRPEGTKSTQGVELAQLTERAAHDKPPEVSLQSFLSSMRAAGFSGAGKGAEQLKDALKKLQQAAGLPPSGRVDAQTAQILVRRGIIDERALPMTMSNESPRDVRAQPQQATLAHADASHGRVAPEGDRGKGGGAAAEGGTGQDAVPTSSAAGAHAPAGTAGTGDVNDPWRTGDHGNAPAGDDDIDDGRRGRANVDDGDHADQGHWEVPLLSVQLAAALAAIVRDDEDGGAATYAWDVALFRPGIYGALQPAERLFHLVVTKASAFDPLWEEARAALNEKLALLEPEAALVQADDFARSLRVARMKDRLR
jgi:hypothetical protein